MPESARTSEAGSVSKRGLHGWRAFFAVFGCGTLAALVVFGSIYGVIRGAIGSFSSEPGSSTDANHAEPKPRESLGVEKVEACKRIESFSLLGANPAKRTDSEGENYVDDRRDGLGRVISDSCQWDVNPPEGSADWEFTFSFDAYVEAPSDSSMGSISSSEYDDKIQEVSNEYDSLESQGDASQGNVTAKYFYGDLESGSEEPTYTAVAHSHTAVYIIRIKDVTDPSLRLGEPTGEDSFHNSSKLTIDRVGGFFSDVLPDDV